MLTGRVVAVIAVVMLVLSLGEAMRMVVVAEDPSGSGIASGEWKYRRTHEIIGSTADSVTDYQVRIVVAYSNDSENLVPFSENISTIPVPAGASKIISGQGGTYWDGHRLHFWFGASADGTSSGDDIYYTYSEPPFTSWASPVKVIDRSDGCRDPTLLVEGEYIYLFLQCYDGSNYRPIRIYKIHKDADFADPSNYIYVGDAIDVGSSGSFDDMWVASPAVVKINGTYYLAYEALSSDGTYAIGLAYSTSIESLPWTKLGPLKDPSGNVIRNPVSSGYAIVPCTFADEDTLFIHYYDGRTWHIRYINGDFAGNNVTLSQYDLDPPGTVYVTAVSHVGFINGTYYFTATSRYIVGETVRIRLYKQADYVTSVEKHSRADFADVRFTASDGKTVLPYWIERKVDGKFAVFWVKVPSIPQYPDSTTIYIYYGNPEATSMDNGEEVFVFFDDFLDLSAWTEVGSVTLSNGEVSMTNSGEWDNLIISNDQFSVDGYAVGVRAKGTGTGAKWQIIVNFGDVRSVSAAPVAFGVKETKFLYDYNDAGTKILLTSTSYFTGRYYVIEARMDPPYILFARDYFVDFEATGWDPPSTSNVITLGCSDGTATFDWIYIRKFIYPEPSHGVWGAEERTIKQLTLPSKSLRLAHKITQRFPSATFNLSFEATNGSTAGYSNTTYGFKVYANPYDYNGASYENTAKLLLNMTIDFPYAIMNVEKLSILARTNSTGSFRQLWLKILNSSGGVVAELTNATLGTDFTEITLPINSVLTGRLTIWINATVTSTSTTGEEIELKDIMLYANYTTNPVFTIYLDYNVPSFDCDAEFDVTVPSYLNESYVKLWLIDKLNLSDVLYNGTSATVTSLGTEVIGSDTYNVYRVDNVNASAKLLVKAKLTNAIQSITAKVKEVQVTKAIIGESVVFEVPEPSNITLSVGAWNATYYNVTSVMWVANMTGTLDAIANLTETEHYKIGRARTSLTVKYGEFNVTLRDLEG